MEQRRFHLWWRVHLKFAFVAVLLLFGRAVWAQIRYSVSEEQKDGTVVGNIAKDLGIDHKTLKERGLRLVSNSGYSMFKVNQNDGMVFVSGNIDRERMCEKSTSCLIDLKIALENPLEIHYVTIEIIDVNDHSPVFLETESLLDIWESALPGTRFQLQAALDPDIGSNSIQTYKLSQNDNFRLEVRDRGDGGKIPILVLKKPLDREITKSMKVLLSAFDGGKSPNSGTVEININVLDVNDNMPVFTKDIYEAILSENMPVGTTVIQINATDLDEGPNGEIFYAFANNVDSKLHKLFAIDSITGEIIVKGNVDFEAMSTYEIDIQASDKGTVPLTTDKIVTIKIVDVNDNAPEIEVTSFSNTVSEDSKPGTTVALISLSDLDSGMNGRVLCFIPESIPFKLMPSAQNNIYSLLTTSALDRERKDEYDITLVAKDAGQPPLSSMKTIKVIVSDVNDNTPEFCLAPYNFYIMENNVPGMSVFSVSASDKDTNTNAAVTYELLRNNGEKYTAFISINSQSGWIYILKSLDFESVNFFNFQVLAKDSGNPSLSTNVTVNVFILDENDNAPVILYPVSTNGSTESVEEIPRNVNAGHLVAKVRAYDPDIGYNGWLLFSFQEVSDHTLFGLDRYTGQIRTLRSFTETVDPEHKLVILVKDNGNISLSATATVIVKVVEPREAVAASDVKETLRKEDENSVLLYLIITLGAVSGLFIISIMVLIAMHCSKAADYSSAFLHDANYDGTLCHSIQYRSGDKHYMFVGPRMSIGSTGVLGSNRNTLEVPNHRRASGEVRWKKK